ncbi:MAG: transcription-repair coupling factor, partial [Erysipelotrichaceae bacterium]|nr:transcription-repair coupling factor [Erysipelotrichaceae bacterium]
MKDWSLVLQQDDAVIALSGKKKNVVLSALDTPLVIAASFRRDPRNMVVITNNLYSAQQLYRKLIPLVNSDVLLLAVEESLRVEAIAASPTMYAAIMESLTTLVMDSRPKIIITHPMALMRYVPQKEIYLNHIIDLKNGQQISMSDLRRKLVENGYHFSQRVEKPLTFSLRGS